MTDGEWPRRWLVVVADGLGPAAVGCYGQERFSTPTLDRWASEGTVFDAHFASTLGAAEHLHAALFETSGVVTAWAGPAGGACHGLPWGFTRTWRRDPNREWSADDARLALQALWRAIPADAPALVVLELDALQPPWHVDLDTVADDEEPADEEEATDEEPPLDPWLGDLPATADDNVRRRLLLTHDYLVEELDAALDAIAGDCDAEPRAGDPGIIVTSRRGLALGERGPVGLRTTEPHEEAVHLPLIVRFPDSRLPGRRCPHLTQPADLWTALAVGKDAPLWSLAPLRDWHLIATPTHSAIRTADWYVVYPHEEGPPRLYLKPDDRWEVNDVAAREPDTVDALRLRRLLDARKRPT